MWEKDREHFQRLAQFRSIYHRTFVANLCLTGAPDARFMRRALAQCTKRFRGVALGRRRACAAR